MGPLRARSAAVASVLLAISTATPLGAAPTTPVAGGQQAPSTRPTNGPVARSDAPIPLVVTSFARVQGSGVAYRGGPIAYRVGVRNMSGAPVSRRLFVKRMPGTADETDVRTILVSLAKGETKEVELTDTIGLTDGCNPTRYSLAIDGSGVRTARIVPTCTFSFATTAATDGPQGQFSGTRACGEPWKIRRTSSRCHLQRFSLA